MACRAAASSRLAMRSRSTVCTHWKRPGNVPRLVGLDGADEMPSQRKMRQRRHLGQRLLQVVLPEVGEPNRVGGFDFRRAPRLGNRQQPHIPAHGLRTRWPP